MEPEEELLMRAKTGAQGPCHFRYKARKCPRYSPVEKFGSPAEMGSFVGERGRGCLCVHPHGTNTGLSAARLNGLTS